MIWLMSLASIATANPVTVRVVSSTPSVVAVFGAIAAAFLVTLLVMKELLDAYAREPHVEGTLRQEAAERVSFGSTAAVIPMMAIFALAVLVKVLEVL